MATIVEETETQTTTTDPDAGKSTFGDIVLEKKASKSADETQVKEPPATKSEPVKEPPKNRPRKPLQRLLRSATFWMPRFPGLSPRPNLEIARR